MNYKFPFIRRIEDVLPAIEGASEFIVAEREFGTVINYVVAMPGTFPPVQSEHDAIRRECRGIIFDTKGNIMSRPFHKFFNVGEREETLVSNLEDISDAVIMEKLDGSMIRPIRMPDGSLRLGTKMGITDVSILAEKFVSIKEWEEMDILVRLNLTPIFEFTSPQNRIVVPYTNNAITLIAMRDKFSGEYYDLNNFGLYFLTARTFDNSNTLDSFVKTVRDQSDLEGWVVRWPSGHMAKIKCDWYVTLHKAKESILHEKNVVDLIVNEKLDDLKANLQDVDKKRIEKFEKEFWDGFNKEVIVSEVLNALIRKIHKTKKDFALSDAHMDKAHQDANKPIKSMVFALWDDKITVRDYMLNVIRRNCSTQTQVDSVRWMWDNAKYDVSSEIVE